MTQPDVRPHDMFRADPPESAGRRRLMRVALGAGLVAGPAAGLAGLLVGAGPARAQAYPDRPVRLVVPFPPGGSVDILGRALAERMAVVMGQPFVVENRPGAAGAIGADLVARAPADGYTLLVGPDATFTMNPHVVQQLSFDPLKDLTPVAMLANLAMALAVHPSVPAATMDEFIAYLRKGSVEASFGTPGTGTPHHLTGALLARTAGVNLVHVPYKGGAPAVADAVAGHIPMVIGALGVLMPHAQAGRLRILGVTQGQRSAASPQVPSIGETVQGFDVTSWLGLFAPDGTPPAVLQVLRTTVGQALSEPALASTLAVQGLDVVRQQPADMAAQIGQESQRWKTFIQDGGIRLER